MNATATRKLNFAFTLIELLVVILIIAVLAYLLLPFAGKPRDPHQEKVRKIERALREGIEDMNAVDYRYWPPAQQ